MKAGIFQAPGLLTESDYWLSWWREIPAGEMNFLEDDLHT